MNTLNISKEQFKLYEAVLDEFERLRTLSPEEKEDILLGILSPTYIDLMCDWAFKHVFGYNERNLMLLLNDILPEKITHITYDPNEVDRWKGDDRNVIMDVMCHTESGEKFIVEMQKGDKAYLRNRMLYYGASMIHTQLKKGDSYGIMKPVYVICFMNFRLRHDSDRLIYKYKLYEEGGELYGNLLTIYLCELPRLVSKSRKDMTPVEIWFDLLTNMKRFTARPDDIDERYAPIFDACRQGVIPEEDKLKYVRSMVNDDIRSWLTDEERQESYEKGFAEGRKQSSWLTDEERQESYEKGLAEGRDEGREEGREEGIAIGETKKNKAIAQKMLQLGLTMETITNVTGLSENDIRSLKD